SGIGTTGFAVVVDIGGGSTEIAAGESVVAQARSFDMGSVRLTGRVLPERPTTRERIANARKVVDETLGSIPWARGPGQVIGVAGTFTSLSAINLGLDVYDRSVVDGSRLSLPDINELVEMLRVMTLSETAAIPSLDPKRAPVILAGAVIAAQTLSAIGATSVIVSEHDLLDGLANELISANPGLPAT
ncbi:MAG: exopolyphosphatase, partial [Acidimicrobiia bacterium]